MAINALFLTSMILMVVGIVLLQELQFLVPYRALLIGPYFRPIALFATALFVNLFALIYLVLRHVFLKDTGRKLAHLEKQLRTDTGLSAELSDRLKG